MLSSQAVCGLKSALSSGRHAMPIQRPCRTAPSAVTRVTRQSKHSVAETAARLEGAILASGVYKIFFKLDHAANAEREAGPKIPPSQLLLFGYPRGGAPLITIV